MNLLQQYQHWYNRTFVKLEVVKLLANKETALLDYKKSKGKGADIFNILQEAGFKKGACIRNINAGFLDILEKNLMRYGFYDNAYRLYYSLATFKQHKYPQFSFSPRTRREEQKSFVKEFTENPMEFMAGYDFALEIDSVDFGEGYKQAKRAKEIFDDFKLPYSLKPSGGKLGGFHFRIDYKHFQKHFSPFEMIFFTFVVNKEIKELENLPDIDTSIFDARRIWKCDYSLVFGANCQWNVCLPLSDYQFKSLPIDISPLNVLKEVKIKERGILERESNQSAIKRFIDEWYLPALETNEYSGVKDRRITGTK